MAEGLYEAGYTQKKIFDLFKDGFEVKPTQESFKDIFRTVGHAMYGIESTADLDTVQLQEVYRVVDQRFAELTGVSFPFPSNEPPLLEEHSIK